MAGFAQKISKMAKILFTPWREKVTGQRPRATKAIDIVSEDPQYDFKGKVSVFQKNL